MTKFFISTIPFSSTSAAPIEMMAKHNIEYEINSYGRKITEKELANLIDKFDVLIAGTEPITKKVLEKAKKLKVISRVGVGVDNIDLKYAQKKGIEVKISSEGPVDAVAEYTIGLILSLTRQLLPACNKAKLGIWEKTLGKDIKDSTIGIIGAGRIGKRVIEIIKSFSPNVINYYDPYSIAEIPGATEVELEDLISSSDILSFHLPLNEETKNLITIKELKAMKKEALIVNTSRGGIINEKDLYLALKDNIISGAALDVFTIEPYEGKLKDLENCIISPHMAPMSIQAREAMELDAIRQAIDALSIKNQK